jgi:hypothetical protein
MACTTGGNRGVDTTVDVRVDLECTFIEYARAATLILETIPAHRDYSMSLNAEQGSNLKAVSGFLSFLLAESASDIPFASIARPVLRILRDARTLRPRILSSNLSLSLSNHPAIPSFSFSLSLSNICIRSHINLYHLRRTATTF